MSNAPLIEWNSTGLVAPKEPDILTGVLEDYNVAFGGNLNTTNLESPQGQLASSLTSIMGAFNDMLLRLVQQVDPQFADGSMQDAIGHIYFIDRKPALATTVDLVCSGAIGTVIPLFAKAQDTNNNIYQATTTGTIDSTGSVTIAFENVVTGDIAAAANTVTKIYQSVLGWETVNNPLDGTPGRAVESRADFEQRRNDSVFLGSVGSLDSAYAAVFNVANVLDVYVQQNLTASPIVVGSTSYSIPAGAAYIAVKGGNDADIAQAIYSKILAKLVGNTVVNVQNVAATNSTAITFERPASLPIKFAVSIKDDPLLPSNIIELIKSAIVDAFNGADGGERARIGLTIYASRYYAPISVLDSTVKLISVLVGTTTATLNSVDVGIDQFPTVSKSNITVTLV